MKTILFSFFALLAMDLRVTYSAPAKGWNYRELGAIESACAETSKKRSNNPRLVGMCTGHYESEGHYKKCNGNIKCVVDTIYRRANGGHE